MADLAILAEQWSQYEGQMIVGSVTCPQTDEALSYSYKLVNVLWDGIGDSVSFRLNDGHGTDHEFLLLPEQLTRTPQQVLAGFKAVIEQGLLDSLEVDEFADIVGEEI